MPKAIKKFTVMDDVGDEPFPDDERSPRGTAIFNVGGKHYEISVTDQKPESMLPKLISWNRHPSKPIFIDRDGDIFGHVLNYLRYGSIELPASLPRAMFERELDFYGISAEEGHIWQSTSVGTMKAIKMKIHDAELQHDMLLIAANCYSQFMSGRTTVHVGSVTIDLKHNPYFYDQKAAMITLNGFLGKFYGLEAFHLNKLFASDPDFVLKVKELASEVQDEAGEGAKKICTHLPGAICSRTKNIILSVCFFFRIHPYRALAAILW